MSNVIRIDAESLRRLTEVTFLRYGFSSEQAAAAADVLLYADLHGLDSHGVCNLLPIYVKALSDRSILPSSTLRRVRKKGAISTFDASGMLGLLAAKGAMEAAIELAAEHSVGAVTVMNSSHFGAAGYFARMAAQSGMIGLALTNLGNRPVGYAQGSRRAIIGTNPLGFASPAGDLPSFVLDMSTTVVASGKIKLAKDLGEEVPVGWMVNQSGQPVTDPHSYLEGSGFLVALGGWQRSTGGHKGLGLSLLVEVLSGVLSGASVSLGFEDEQNSIGHFLFALDVSAFLEGSIFAERMERFLSSLLGEPVFEGHEALTYPGHSDAKIALERGVHGIPLPAPTVAALNWHASTLGAVPLAEIGQ
ncbi:Ldh family oxidoreductase [Rhizobium mongolense]|uniref:Ldh family oxidoreductase n=1 Tax=Rhizobium mongolense TaxID=57676 RepID=UPI0034A5471F